MRARGGSTLLDWTTAESVDPSFQQTVRIRKWAAPLQALRGIFEWHVLYLIEIYLFLLLH